MNLEIKKKPTHCLTIQGSKIKILKNWITMKTLPIETCDATKVALQRKVIALKFYISKVKRIKIIWAMYLF